MPDSDDQLDASGKPIRKAIRNVGRLFDAVGEAMWIVDAGHALIYINAEAAQWLGRELTDLLGRRCHAAIDRSTPIGDALAAIAPPLGLTTGAELVVDVGPPTRTKRRIRFTKHGEGDDSFVVGTSGAIVAAVHDVDLESASAIRQRLEPWRRQQSTSGLIIAAGSSPDALRIRSQIQLAASTRQSIAIIGPPGAGGESVAKRIHAIGNRSGRDADPIMVVETPLMDAELLEATLSPAAAYLSRGNHASVTLLLRGLDESPHEVQDRIIDFAAGASGSVRLAGLLSESPAVERDSVAKKLTAKMALAMSIFELRLPALADRAEDIPLIATALVENRHALGKCMAERLSRAALDRLLLYPWPHNFEELDAAIRHAGSVCRASTIGPDDLPLSIRSFRSHGVSKPKPIVTSNLDDAMRDFELRKIHQALQVADGNRSEAARLLGISRARLLRRLDDSADQANDDHPTDS